MVSLDTGERDQVLPQLDVSGVINSPWEALPFLRSKWGCGGVKVGGEGEGMGEGNVVSM